MHTSVELVIYSSLEVFRLSNKRENRSLSNDSSVSNENKHDWCSTEANAWLEYSTKQCCSSCSTTNRHILHLLCCSALSLFSRLRTSPQENGIRAEKRRRRRNVMNSQWRFLTYLFIFYSSISIGGKEKEKSTCSLFCCYCCCYDYDCYSSY